MKKILIISYQLSGRGGTENVLRSWGSFFSGRDFIFDIIVRGERCDTSFLEGFSNIHFLNKSIFPALDILRLARLVFGKNYDIVISLSPKLCLAAFFVKLIFREKYKNAIWPHFHIPRVSLLERICFRNSDLAFAVCDGAADELISHGFNPSSVRVIYNPISRADFIRRPAMDEMQIFYFIGRFFEPHKRVLDIISASEALKLRGINFRLVIKGQGRDAQLYKDCVISKGLQNFVFIEDEWVSNPWIDIFSMTALILSSNYEGFGLVLAESMARGVPVISSNCKVGPIEIVTDGLNGYLYEVGDVNALAEKMHMMIISPNFFDSFCVSGSVSRFYEDEYFKKLNKILSSEVCS